MRSTGPKPKMEIKAVAGVKYEKIPLPPIENIVFEGGGVKGSAYCGVLQALEEKKALDHVKRVGGSSAGAITALLIGLGHSVEEITELVEQLKFDAFLDPIKGQDGNVKKFLLGKEIMLLDLFNTAKTTPNFGIIKGQKFLAWIQSLVEHSELKAPNATFADLHHFIEMNPGSAMKDIYVTASNITSDQLEIFSWETTPNVSIALAVRASMSFPAVFEGVRTRLPGRDKEELFVDGGLFYNYPVKIFDHLRFVPKGHEVYFGQTGINPAVIGVKVDEAHEMARTFWNMQSYRNIHDLVGSDPPSESKEQKAPIIKVSPVNKGEWKEKHAIGHLYASSHMLFGVSSKKFKSFRSKEEEEKESRIYHSHRTIQTHDEGIDTLNFHLSDEEIEKLVVSGRRAANAFMRNYREDASLAMLLPTEEKAEEKQIPTMSIPELLYAIQKLTKEIEEKAAVTAAPTDTIEMRRHRLEERLIDKVTLELDALKNINASNENKTTPRPQDLALMHNSIFNAELERISPLEKEIITLLSCLLLLRQNHLKDRLAIMMTNFNEEKKDFEDYPDPVVEGKFNSKAFARTRYELASDDPFIFSKYEKIVKDFSYIFLQLKKNNDLLNTLGPYTRPAPEKPPPSSTTP